MEPFWRRWYVTEERSLIFHDDPVIGDRDEKALSYHVSCGYQRREHAAAALEEMIARREAEGFRRTGPLSMARGHHGIEFSIIP